VTEERSVGQVYTKNPERGLLVDSRRVMQLHMNYYFGWVRARLSLKSHAQPSVSSMLTRPGVRGRSIGKNKEGSLIAALLVQSCQQQCVFRSSMDDKRCRLT